MDLFSGRHSIGWAQYTAEVIVGTEKKIHRSTCCDNMRMPVTGLTQESQYIKNPQFCALRRYLINSENQLIRVR